MPIGKSCQNYDFQKYVLNVILKKLGKYSRGSRGRFAKSLDWETGAQVRILSSPSDTSIIE
ncbi:hypothetical protein LPICM02_250098 [Pseudolactococcus piscium]|nr:hypothetical protein LPICM02_250098 [Lactococcus piscium]